MPYRRKDSPIWWVSFTDTSGKRIRKATGTIDRKEAAALEAKWKLEVFQEKKWDKAPSWSFEEVLLEFLKATQDKKRSAYDDRSRSKLLLKHFSGIVMNDLNSSDIRMFIASRKKDGVTDGTINRYLRLLSAAINYVNREHDAGLPNPVSGRTLKEAEGRLRWLSHKEGAELIKFAKGWSYAPHLADFIRLALNTGCRSGEMLGLEWDRVDFGNKLIYLDGVHTKNGKRRSVPLNGDALLSLESRLVFRNNHCPKSKWVFCHLDGRRIGDVKRSFASVCKKVGIVDFRIHDMRHTCAAWLVTANVPLAVVRDLLGHSSIVMTERYAHLAPENIRDAVDLLNGVGHDLVTANKKGASENTLTP
jgi:integrase